MRFNLGHKLAAVVGVLLLLAIALQVIGQIESLRDQDRSETIEAAWSLALQARTLAQAVEHTVVEATNVFTAVDKTEAKSKFTGLEDALAALRALQGPFIAALLDRMPDQARLRLKLQLDEFIAYENDTAQLGLTISPKAALIQATDPATVKNRQTMLATIDGVSTGLIDELAKERRALRATRARNATLFFFLLPALTIAIGVGIATWIAAFQIQRPLDRLRRSLRTLAGGDLAEEIDFLQRKDEIGEMAMAIGTVQRALRAKQASDSVHARRVEEEAARAACIIDRARGFELDALGRMEALSNAVAAMAAGAGDVAVSSDQTKTASGHVLESARSAAAALSAVSVATEELTISARSIETTAERTSGCADAALREAHTTKEQVWTLESAADEIGEAAALIGGIAAQTNLLSLNATIEAARAGAAGRGFAVVAQEVKTLAQRTSDATTRIAQQIDAIQRTTKGTADAIRSIVERIDEISGLTGEVSRAVSDQSRASREIAQAISGASVNADVVSVSTGQVQTAALFNEQRSRDLRATAAIYGEQATQLCDTIQAFVAELRVA